MPKQFKISFVINYFRFKFQVQKKTLNPVWDQTLLCKQLVVYGASDYIKKHPPLAILDVLDQDECVCYISSF